MNNQTPKPDMFYKINVQARVTAAMLAAMELDLFTPLDEAPMNTDQLASSLEVNAEKLGPLLYSLVTYDFLIEEDGYFSNTAETSYYFVRGKEHYIGESAKIWKNNILAALTTAETIRTGVPQAKYDWRNMDQDKLNELMEGMAAFDYTFAHWISGEFDFSNCKSLLDAGCGSGALAITMTEIHPQLTITVVDLPEVTPITEKNIQKANVEDKVKIISADLSIDQITGNYDAAILGSIIQVVSPEEARKIILNVGNTVNPGGWLYIFGSGILMDSRLSPPAAVGINMVLINVYDHGRSYTEKEHCDWLNEAGFHTIKFDYDQLFIAAQKDLE
jgi:2-polyprenyl-3-methyl-5-hydroxy-6-metoxy-1,4-benzoquinol methylase